MGLLDDRRDEYLVQRLLAEWKEVYKISRFMKPRIGAATMVSAVEFAKLSERLKVKLRQAVEAVCGRYSPEWCQQTFKMPYAPFPVVVGKSSRKWLAHEFGVPKSIKATPADLAKQAVEIVNTMLGTMTRASAEEVVAGGWPADAALRAQVQKELAGRK